MQAIDWNDYQVFIAVAQTGQIARAAKKLGVDATTIGRRLRRLEAQYGATLFEQTREGQALTEAGENLLASVEIMASAADNAVPKQNAEHGPGGTLRVSVSEGFGSWFLTRHIPDFIARYPNMKIDLVASSGFLNPSKREADIAVVLSRPKAGQVIAQKLSSYKLCLYASQSYARAHDLPEKPADLASGHRLISYIPDLLYAPELNYLDEILPGLQPTIRSSSINAQHRLIASGTGMGVLPCFIGDTDPTLVPLRSCGMIDRTFWLVTHKDNRSLARIKAGKEWLLDIVHRERLIVNPSV